MEPNQIICGDNLEVMRGMATGSVALTLTSPPYVDQRTYGIGFKLKGQGWVDWMIPRVVEMCRVTAGLVFVNMAGKVKDWKYQPVVEWLVADLTRLHGIVCGPSPYVFHKIGIPGSGSKHYHRRDWEPVYAFALPENLPPKWSDNTAMGHPPKWAPGGEMSNRLSSGKRVNQWGPPGSKNGMGKRFKHGEDAPEDSKTPRPSHVTTAAGKNQWGHSLESGATVQVEGGAVHTKNNGDGMVEQAYTVPAIANPGNTIQERYTADEVAALLAEAGDVTHHLVGGGVMGSKKAHENEAPFPNTLAEFFIRSFAPEDSIVFDPFAGSGTVLAVAEKWGRKWLGIDVRQSQVDLSKRRVAEVELPLFS